MRAKDKLYRQFLNTRNPDDLAVFKRYRNQLTKQLRTARKEYFSRFLDDKNVPSELLWDKLNTLLRRDNQRTCISKLTIDGQVLHEAELADAFNIFLQILVRQEAPQMHVSISVRGMKNQYFYSQ